jgi:hypothetical protein
MQRTEVRIGYPATQEQRDKQRPSHLGLFTSSRMMRNAAVSDRCGSRTISSVQRSSIVSTIRTQYLHVINVHQPLRGRESRRGWGQLRAIVGEGAKIREK